jgi:hypothetical protein
MDIELIIEGGLAIVFEIIGMIISFNYMSYKSYTLLSQLSCFVDVLKTIVCIIGFIFVACKEKNMFHQDVRISITKFGFLTMGIIWVVSIFLSVSISVTLFKTRSLITPVLMIASALYAVLKLFLVTKFLLRFNFLINSATESLVSYLPLTHKLNNNFQMIEYRPQSQFTGMNYFPQKANYIHSA